MLTPPVDLNDLQAVFDYIVGGVLRQGRQAYDPGTGLGTTRTPDGLRCAVGQLIPLDVPLEKHEYNAVFAGLTRVYGMDPDEFIMRSPTYKLLIRLLGAHDARVDEGEDFKALFSAHCRVVARDHNLNYNEDLYV